MLGNRQHAGTEDAAGRRQGVLPAASETLGTVHIAAAYLLVVAVFGFDLILPLGVGLSFFYLVPVVFLALWSSPKQALAVLRIAAFSAILVGVGFLLSPPGDL
jgi:ABC-type proline/glycine betaine transport system permease subunit